MARSRETNEQLREQRIEKILSGALELFADRGLAATRISDIAKATGMSQGLVYHYYQSKEQIYTQIITRAFSRLHQACLGLEAMEMPADRKIVLALTKLIQGFAAGPEASRSYLLIAQASASASTPAETLEVIRENRDLPYQCLERIFTRGQAEGTVQPQNPAQLAILFWTTINGLAIYASSHGPDFPLPSVDLVARFFIKGDNNE